jgi:hypothetical protein
MKKKGPCCRKIKDYIGLEKSSFSSLKSGAILLRCGTNRVTIRTIKRLIKAIGSPLPKNIKLPSGPPNKLVKVPLIVPIEFCPFCGKKVNPLLSNAASS